jgi:hypothetical protein
MNRLALLALPVLTLATPAMSGDYYGRYPRESIYYYRPAPQVLVRERIIERHYYTPAPAYRERVYYKPPFAYYPPRRVYAYDYRPRYYAPRWRHWHHHRHHWW